MATSRRAARAPTGTSHSHLRRRARDIRGQHRRIARMSRLHHVFASRHNKTRVAGRPGPANRGSRARPPRCGGVPRSRVRRCTARGVRAQPWATARPPRAGRRSGASWPPRPLRRAGPNSARGEDRPLERPALGRDQAVVHQIGMVPLRDIPGAAEAGRHHRMPVGGGVEPAQSPAFALGEARRSSRPGRARRASPAPRRCR